MLFTTPQRKDSSTILGSQQAMTKPGVNLGLAIPLSLLWVTRQTAEANTDLGSQPVPQQGICF